MKTAIISTNPAIKLPPLSAVLLLLSFFFSIAAWRAMDINQDLIPHRPYQEAVPRELSADSTSSRATDQAHRHPAVPLGSGSATARVIQTSGSGPISKSAVL